VKKLQSSSSLAATAGDWDSGAPDSKLASLRLKDSSNKLIVDKALVMGKRQKSFGRGQSLDQRT